MQLLALNHNGLPLSLGLIALLLHTAADGHDDGHDAEGGQNHPKPRKFIIIGTSAGDVLAMRIRVWNRIDILLAHPGLGAVRICCFIVAVNVVAHRVVGRIEVIAAVIVANFGGVVAPIVRVFGINCALSVIEAHVALAVLVVVRHRA